MLRNIIGRIFNTTFCFFFVFFAFASSSCVENEIFFNKQTLTKFSQKKDKNWTNFNSTTQNKRERQRERERLYIYIYIYIGGDPNWWARVGQKSQFSQVL